MGFLSWLKIQYLTHFMDSIFRFYPYFYPHGLRLPNSAAFSHCLLRGDRRKPLDCKPRVQLAPAPINFPPSTSPPRVPLSSLPPGPAACPPPSRRRAPERRSCRPLGAGHAAPPINASAGTPLVELCLRCDASGEISMTTGALDLRKLLAEA